MTDLEKVIKELESLRDICNAKSNMAIGKGKVAWAGYANTADDAIDLLKEQGKQKFFVEESGKITPLPVIVRCKDCKKWHVDCLPIFGRHRCDVLEYYTRADDYCSFAERKEGGEAE